MRIKEDTRKKLIDEIKFILSKMKKEIDREQKIYYFSGIHGIISRIFNFEYDPELIFAHVVLSFTHSNIHARLAEEEKIIKVPDEFLDKLVDTTEELLKKIEINESLYDTLQKFSVIGYATTGNGYYLYQKGLLRL